MSSMKKLGVDYKRFSETGQKVGKIRKPKMNAMENLKVT